MADWRGIPGLWRRGWVIAFLALVVAGLLALHDRLPNSIGNAGSLVETVLPWIGLFIPLLAICAGIRRSATAGIALLLPLAVWFSLFGSLFAPGKGGGQGNLTVVTHNVNAGNPAPAHTARELMAAKADLVALEELQPDSYGSYEKVLHTGYKYETHRGTVALFSKYPIDDVRTVNIDIGWTRALRAVVDGPDGRMAVYVAHLASVRIDRSGFTAGQRDQTIKALGDEIAKEPLQKVILMGDLNGSANDRSLSPVTSQLRSAQAVAGHGFGFSWPKSFPIARIDHILVRGVQPEDAWTLPATDSDHLPIGAHLKV